MRELELETSLGNISYLESNSEATKTIIFIHGNSCSKEIFLNQLSDSKFEDYQLIAIDLFGHGNSSSLSETYTLDIFAKQIEIFVNELSISNFYLVGHSLGGHICIRAAKKLEDKMCGLVIFGTPPLSSVEDFPLGFLPHPSAGAFFNKSPTDDEVLDLIQNLLGNSNKEFELDLVKVFKATDPEVRFGLSQTLSKLDIDEKEVIESLGFRTLIINCTKDKFINSEYISNLGIENLEMNPPTKIDCGHVPQVELSNKLNSIILGYISKS